jgi:hypothetical protein
MSFWGQIELRIRQMKALNLCDLDFLRFVISRLSMTVTAIECELVCRNGWFWGFGYDCSFTLVSYWAWPQFVGSRSECIPNAFR